MADHEPIAEPIPSSEQWSKQSTFNPNDAVVTPWTMVRERLAEGRTYWLATTRPDGQPHVMPLLAVWVDDALHFVANAGSRKAQNLKQDPRCVITLGALDIDLVVECKAVITREEGKLNRVADGFMSKYGWPVEVRDAAFVADGAPTAGPPPYDVYQATPRVAFGFSTDGTLGWTRWRFRSADSHWT